MLHIPVCATRHVPYVPTQAIDEDTGHPEPGSCGELVVAAWTELAETGGLAGSLPPMPLDTFTSAPHGLH